MYTISPEMYNRISSYVVINKLEGDTSTKSFIFKKKEYPKKAFVIVDVNTGDSTQLEEVRGIGPTLARQIFKYRERLGGFYKTEQLLEVYGLDSNRFLEIKDQVKLSQTSFKVVNVNTAQFDDLKANPYLSYKQLNAIIQYRKQHGKYSGVTDLRKVVILSEDVIDKITPYISF